MAEKETSSLRGYFDDTFVPDPEDIALKISTTVYLKPGKYKLTVIGIEDTDFEHEIVKFHIERDEMEF